MYRLVMLMGYTASEARRGLRSGQGNIDQAVEFIIEVKLKSKMNSMTSFLFRNVELKNNYVSMKKLKKKKNVCKDVMVVLKMDKSKMIDQSKIEYSIYFHHILD